MVRIGGRTGSGGSSELSELPEEVTPKSRQSCSREDGSCVAGQRESEPSVLVKTQSSLA